MTTTTSTSFVTKLSGTTASVPAGTYRVAFSYGWNYDDNATDFEARFLLDGVASNLHVQEPKDIAGTFGSTGTDQRFYVNRVLYFDLTAGTHDLDLEYRSTLAGAEASIWDAVIEIWRVQ
ncbi:MAG: hypothetical protein AAF682_30220 [Planctomycetota bacterium]